MGLIFEDIPIDERVAVLGGKYMGARGAVYGKTGTRVRVRFDERVMGEMKGNILPYMLCHIWVPQAASKEEKPATPPNKREVRMIWKSPELQGLGRLLARLNIDPSNSRSLEVCLNRAYEESCRDLEEEPESTWEKKTPGKKDRKGDSA